MTDIGPGRTVSPATREKSWEAQTEKGAGRCGVLPSWQKSGKPEKDRTLDPNSER